MTNTPDTCQHTDQIKPVQPASDTCLECQKAGTHPVQLRLCLTCGHIGCCDSSVGQHARRHFTDTGHPIIESFKSAPPSATEWRYCYIDKAYL
jgi:uncharacterized UBP type Zn finger protein